MKLRNDTDSYGSVTKTLHWMVFTLFTIMFILGFGLMNKSEGDAVLGSDWETIFNWHATLGLIVLFLAAIRIWWRKTTPLPSWAPGLSSGERKLAHRTEQIMYVVMIAKPISGYVLAGAAAHKIELFGAISLGNPFGPSGWLKSVALTVHILTGVGFLLTWVIHVGQVLRHQLVKKDHLLERMLTK